MLCAVVHEYGVNWSLASEILNGMTAGGFYRGIVRHPVHCCERYRELVQRHVLSISDNNVHNEKASNVGVGKALLRVTEVTFLYSYAYAYTYNFLVVFITVRHFSNVGACKGVVGYGVGTS